MSIIFIAGSSDRVTVVFGIDYAAQMRFYRVFVWVLPIVLHVVVKRWCKALQRAEEVERTQARAAAEATFSDGRPTGPRVPTEAARSRSA